MDDQAPILDQVLAHDLLGWSFAFILILCRCGAAIMLLPGIAEDGSIAMLRMGITLGMTVLLLPSIAPSLPPAPDSVPHLAGLIANELFAGGFLGWMARLVALSLPAAGQIISLSTGMSSVLQPDANFGAQTAGIGRLFGVMAPALLLATGAYRLPLSALAGSYAAWPAGGLPPTDDVLTMVVQAVGAHFALALRLASPFMLIGLVWQAGLGLMSRLVPQLQIYFAALPGQVLGGLLLLALLAAPLAKVWLTAAEAAYGQLP
jgi:flagellar biosynthetic protein FliR